MELNRKCKICGEEKPIYHFGKKDKFKYRTECKVCYNKGRREFNKLSEDEKRKVKEESKIRKEQRKLESIKRIENYKIEKEEKKKLRYELLVQEYDKRMNDKLERKNMRMKNYLCCECGETNINNFYPNIKNKCKKCKIYESKENNTKYNRYDKMTDEDKKIYQERYKTWVSKNLVRVRFLSAKHRSIRKNIPFEITEEFILRKLKEQDGRCYISKQKLTFKENDWYGLSLDRLDSNIGYTKDNTVIVTKFVNTSKNILSLDEYIKLMKEVSDNI